MNRAFEKKLTHSIELLRKAESIALKYNSEDGFYLAFSGGKDSQALYHVAKMAGVKFKAHMSLTSVDPPQVIRFVKKEYPDVVLHKPKMSIYQDAIERQILPTMRVRWCCADFKESAGAGQVTLIGIRAAESTRRAKRHEVEVTRKKFSGDLDEFEQWSKEQIEKQQKKSKRKINEDEFSIKSDNEVRCINGKDSILVSPIFQWTDKDVWYFLNEVAKVPHCSLYDEGYTRIGCILCPMSTYKSKLRDIKRFPHAKRNWIKAIKAIRRGGYSKTIISSRISQRDGWNKHCSKDGNSTRRLMPPTIRGLWGNRENQRKCTAEEIHPSGMAQIRRKLDYYGEKILSMSTEIPKDATPPCIPMPSTEYRGASDPRYYIGANAMQHFFLTALRQAA